LEKHQRQTAAVLEMEKNGRIPFKDKVHFRKKIDETWYRTGSHESPETYTEQEERNATRYERIPTHAKHQPGGYFMVLTSSLFSCNSI